MNHIFLSLEDPTVLAPNHHRRRHLADMDDDEDDDEDQPQQQTHTQQTQQHHSPQSPPSSKFSISNFDSDLVDHHVDLNHSLPSYGNLFEPHSIPVSYIRMMTMTSGWIIVRSVDCTTQRRRRPPMGTSSRRNGYSSYAMNGKFDDDSDALCDAANFIYN